MCLHVCFRHRERPAAKKCCSRCTCGKNIKLSEIDKHFDECHGMGSAAPWAPTYKPNPPSARVPLPAPVGVPVAA